MMALLRRKGSIHAIDGKYPDNTSDSDKKKIEGDALSVIQMFLEPNVLCESFFVLFAFDNAASTEETGKQLWERLEGLYSDRKEPITFEQVRQVLNSCDVRRQFERDKGDEASGLFVRGRPSHQGRSKSKNILKSLSLAYGQMILRSGFFHADPHPGNILICKGAEASTHLFVALLDYGQVKDLPENLRLGYANLILAIADGDATRARESFKELGIDTLSKCEDEQKEMLKLARGMFDTKLPPGVKMLQPFSEESSVKKIEVEAFPEELFSILRTLQILRGLSVGLGISHSCAEQWRPIAEEALYNAGRLTDIDMKRSHRHRTRRKSGK
ncbi:hypothetical protein H5410_035579 [Solanum commersonii]|uniref:ABC1 atypical kinase-like domain-containing protein n=1 Tax=Solanum commersonii TaxID=4109 RepID=A0A9J5Y132_SOLCO|nr:hypothetical protein H5410_035579 [Solanum commersonii]